MSYTRKFFSNSQGKVVVWQRPNLPLMVWAVAAVVQMLLHGRAKHVVGVVGTGAILYWAVMEVYDGDSYFRRTLGIVVLAMTIMSIVR